MIADYEVFEAIRRGYNDLHTSSDVEIISYFQSIDQGSFSGHVSHIKGILFEQEYIDSLESKNVYAEVFEATNHPVTDIKIFQDGEVISEIQLKATDSLDYGRIQK